MALSLGAKSVLLESTTQCQDWSVKFDLKFDQDKHKGKDRFVWRNVLGFHNDAGENEAGYRQPLVTYNDNGNSYDVVMNFYAQWGNSHPAYSSKLNVRKNKWHSFEIRQENGKYDILIDGKSKRAFTNPNPKQFENVSGFICPDNAGNSFECGLGEIRYVEIDMCLKKPTTVTCMKDDLVHMTASVPVDKVQMDLTTMQDKWELDSVNKVYTKSWTAADFDQESEMSVDKDNNLVLTKRVKSECKNTKVDEATVCLETGHTLDFQCKYPLGTRTVKNTYDVSGHDADVDAEGVGELKYTLSVADNNVDIGNKVAVTVTPLNKNLVYAQLNDCDVTYKDQSVSILDFKDASLQPVCDIGAHVGTGHGKSDLMFDWKAFKWATANQDADKELQTISCNIALSKNAPVTEYGTCPTA